jgi:hypothetical protein
MKLKHGELGSLKNIADTLWNIMLQEIERNGYSDLTLILEGSVHGVNDIIRLNNIEE